MQKKDIDLYYATDLFAISMEFGQDSHASGVADWS